MRAPDNCEPRLRPVPLLAQHVEGKHLLPSPDLALCEGDRLLIGGRAIARAWLRLSVTSRMAPKGRAQAALGAAAAVAGLEPLR